MICVLWSENQFLSVAEGTKINFYEINLASATLKETLDTGRLTNIVSIKSRKAFFAVLFEDRKLYIYGKKTWIVHQIIDFSPKTSNVIDFEFFTVEEKFAIIYQSLSTKKSTFEIYKRVGLTFYLDEATSGYSFIKEQFYRTFVNMHFISDGIIPTVLNLKKKM